MAQIAGNGPVAQEGKVHWLPRPLNECPLTACSLDVEQHPHIAFVVSQNEVTCKRCLGARKAFGPEGDW
jgi:hypothetical protein